MKNNILKTALLALVAVVMLSVGCSKGENEYGDRHRQTENPINDLDGQCNDCHCQVENPITDLAWLKDDVAEFNNSGAMGIKIYTCKYLTNKDGFFFEEAGVYDGQQYLYDCAGNLLCTIGGISGKKDTVYNIDYNSFQLIYKNIEL
ncbi:MAG: hypothetical protein IKJ67_01050 [Bacteroidales bacterium]|nr:hypothetical protein [Bacteroidales bacterium]